ncbi:hypothetical protein [Paludibacterium yongneupense]|uniref:hypothetical protein n=1 Tax=Paludibacterium yongneupense TaxID=400061 RepID=UPI00041544F2|nr:hypothetical protein [Paludibacterium yongneupense]
MKHLVASAMLSLGLLLPAYSALAADTSAPTGWARHQADWQAHHAQRVQARLDHLADMLQLTQAQRQGKAWQNYLKVSRDLAATMPMMGIMHAPRDADAATLTRLRADAAARIATHLSAQADATRELQAALTEAQRKVLAEMVRHEGPMHHGFFHHDADPMHGDGSVPAPAPAGGE